MAWLDPPGTIRRRQQRPLDPALQKRFELDGKAHQEHLRAKRTEALEQVARDLRQLYEAQGLRDNLDVASWHLSKGDNLKRFQRGIREAVALSWGARLGGKVDADSAMLAAEGVPRLARTWGEQLGVPQHALEGHQFWGTVMQMGALRRHVGAKTWLGLSASMSDFPTLLGNGLLLAVKSALKEMPPTWPAWARRDVLPDFREHNVGALGEFGTLEEILEGDEYASDTTYEDSGVTTKLRTFGRALRVSQQALMNDTASVWRAEVPQQMARAVANMQDDLLIEALESQSGDGPDCGDSKTLFHADHNNTVAGALGSAALAEARQKLRDQLATDGVTPLGTPAATLLVPSALEESAYILMDGIADQGKLRIVTEPRLSSGVTWYVVASPRAMPSLLGLALKSQPEPAVIAIPSVNHPDTTIYHVRLDFAVSVAPYGYQGIVKVETGE